MIDKRVEPFLQAAKGALMERVDYEMPKIIDNILDANTKATAKRKLTITVEFLPDDDRIRFSTSFKTKLGLAETNPICTAYTILGEDSTGEMQVVENTPQIPGQYGMDGGEQEAPPILRLIKFA